MIEFQNHSMYQDCYDCQVLKPHDPPARGPPFFPAFKASSQVGRSVLVSQLCKDWTAY